MLSLFDQNLFHWIAGSPSSPTLIVFLAIFCAKVLIYIIPFYLVLFWFYGGEWGRKVVVSVFIAVAAALIISFFIGQLFYRPRPFDAGIGVALIDHRSNASFPSNHALIFSAYVTVLYLLSYRTAAKIGFIAGALTCWARIFVGVHYPFDILGGVLLGAVSGYIVVHYVLPVLPQELLNRIYQLPPRSRNHFNERVRVNERVRADKRERHLYS